MIGQRLAWLFALAAVALGAQLNYTGSQACAGCHADIYKRQVVSHHSQALSPMPGSSLEEVLEAAKQSPDARVSYDRQANGIALSGAGIPDNALLTWAFGAGAQGMTPVGLLDGQYFEHQYSFYTRKRRLAPTFGHPARVNTPIAELGILQDDQTILKCFGCHGTGLDANQTKVDLQQLTPGIQCERCHGPGRDHIARAKAGGPAVSVRRAIVNPGRFPARAQVQICGQCHRLPGPDMGDEPEMENPVNVRFAPIGLMASRCFKESKTLSCLTCHDPHDNAKPRADRSYQERCITCHSLSGKVASHCPRKTSGNCLSCHMQQADLGPYLRFTDHRIRVNY